MNTRLISMLLAGCIVGTIVAATGCCVCWGWWEKQHYERTESLSAAMAGLERISVDTSFGDVRIKGADTTDCNVTAKITGQAPTAEEAKQLAQETQIKLETDGKTLIIKAEKPHTGHNRSIGIAYDITVPAKTAIKCETSFGGIKLANIEGDIEADTSFGEIDAEEISGKMQLDTSYGKVDCKQITSSDFSAKSSFGKIEVGFSDSCPANVSAKIATSYGDIDLRTPKGFAGLLAVETSFGKINTDLPILVKGEFGKDHLTGTVGEGPGSLDLKTSFGNVTIK